MVSKTSTARVAPTGSIMMPSHFSTEATRLVGRTWLSRGMTTVGPDTTKIAPSSSDISRLRWSR